MYTLTKFTTDGEVLTSTQEHEPTLKQLQGAVGGHIELLRTKEGDFFLNEEGKLIGLPYNEKATAFITQHVPLMPGDVIVGNALYVTPHME